MQVKYGDIFNFPQINDAVCVPTNGMVKSNGQAVMGKGLAKAFNDRFCLSRILGYFLQTMGNHVYNLGSYESGFYIFSFPTKNDWRENSDMGLILQSCAEATALMDSLALKTCYLPLPGCGCGNLNESYVLTNISKYLDDRFTLVLRN